MSIGILSNDLEMIGGSDSNSLFSQLHVDVKKRTNKSLSSSLCEDDSDGCGGYGGGCVAS